MIFILILALLSAMAGSWLITFTKPAKRKHRLLCIIPVVNVFLVLYFWTRNAIDAVKELWTWVNENP